MIADFFTHHVFGGVGCTAGRSRLLCAQSGSGAVATHDRGACLRHVPTSSIPQPLGVMGALQRTTSPYTGGAIAQPQSQPSSMPAAGVSMSTRRLCASIPNLNTVAHRRAARGFGTREFPELGG